MKEIIRNKAKELGADLVGFLNLKDYKSPRSPKSSPLPSISQVHCRLSV